MVTNKITVIGHSVFSSGRSVEYATRKFKNFNLWLWVPYIDLIVSLAHSYTLQPLVDIFISNSLHMEAVKTEVTRESLI
jgi:hypothetical protein